MYKNISSKVRGVAKFVAIISIILGIIIIISGIEVASSASRAANIMGSAGALEGATATYTVAGSGAAGGLLIVEGIIVALCGVVYSWLIYAFGQMTEDVAVIKDKISIKYVTADEATGEAKVEGGSDSESKKAE